MKVKLILILLFQLNLCFGNNIQVSNVSLTGQNTDEDFTMVEFDISWENSWRVVGGPGNWDAAWIFVKYKIGEDPWQHAYLHNTDHVACSEGTFSIGLADPNQPFQSATNPGIGAFIYRAQPGNGTFNCSSVQLRWNYGVHNISDNEQIDIQVFAIEMVYVPQGPFKVGAPSAFGFYTYPTVNTPFQISSEASLQVGIVNGDIAYESFVGCEDCGDGIGPIPAAFPKGFRSFYTMKYEISQKGYVDFLNNLTRQQQISRVRATISGGIPSNQYLMTNTNSPTNRNGIWSLDILPHSSYPIFVFCNLTSALPANHISDGLDIACNYLTWADFLAYLDWSGLRPMTELEFEKSCRGTREPRQFEYAWGNTYTKQAYVMTNSGFPNESVTDSLANYTSQNIARCGLFARSTTNRTLSGATFYGALDFSSNIWERCIQVGNSAGRSFQGEHGNGSLTPSGNSNTANWPNVNTGLGGCIKGGGGWSISVVSSRGVFTSTSPFNADGGRGVRTAP